MEYLRKNQVLDIPRSVQDRLPRVDLEPDKIRAVLINEVVPQDAGDDFYSPREDAAYPASALSLFREAGFGVDKLSDLLDQGIYLTNAVKCPKEGYDIPTETILTHRPVLEAELGLFANLKAVLLMGDVAKKALNGIVKARTGKGVIPAGSTYKLRKSEYYWGAVRVFPSYIITGGNLRIEKSKSQMIREDLAALRELLV